MNPIQAGVGPSPENRPTPPPDEEKTTKEGEVPVATQPEVQEVTPQAPAQRVEPVNVQPVAQPEAATPASAQETSSLSPEQAEAEVKKIVDSKPPETAGGLSDLAERLNDTTSGT